MDFKEIIHSKYNQLSKGQQKVAKYLLDRPKDFAIKSANEIGIEAGVSETTVIRFCYAIQFTGFSELQKTVREQLLFQESSLGQYFSSKLEIADEPNFYAQVMKRDSQQIMEMLSLISENDMNQMVDQFMEADSIYIVGMGASFSAANWLAFTLGLVRENVILVRADTGDLLFTLRGISEKSVLISISFHRYLIETIKITKLAKRQGATVIGITDSPLAPVSEFSDLLFPIFPFEKSTIDSTTSLFSFLNAIVAGMTIKDPKKFEFRKMQYEELFKDFFIDGGEAN